MKITLSKKQWEMIGRKAGWENKKIAPKEIIKRDIIDYLSSLDLLPFVNDSEDFDGTPGGIWFGDKEEIFQAYSSIAQPLSEMLSSKGWLMEPYDSVTFMAFPQ